VLVATRRLHGVDAMQEDVEKCLGGGD